MVESDDLDEFTTILEDQGFEKATDRDLDVYGGRYLAYEKDAELPVTIDLLVDELRCRQTGASWSYTYFTEHSEKREIEGSEESIRVDVPEKELLIAVKLHSGRLTDARDTVASRETKSN